MQQSTSKVRMWLASALLLIGACGEPAHAADHEWQLAHYLPADHFFARGFLSDWAQRVEQASDGRLRITIRPNNELLRLNAIAPGVRDGKAQVGFGPAPDHPVFEVMSLPFMADSATSGTELLLKLQARGSLADAMPGLEIGFLQTNAPSVVHSRTKAVRRPEDLAGLRMRGATPSIRELLSTLGAVPIEGFLAPQVYGALRDGKVDGTVFPYEAMGVFRLGEQLDYHTEVPLFVSVLGLFIDADAMAALPADLQAIVRKHTGPETARAAAAAWDAEEVRGREITAALGNTFITPTAEEMAAWKARAEPYAAARLEKLGEPGHAALALVESVKAGN